MASTASKTPLFRTIAARGYAAQAKTVQKASGQDVQTTTLPNKLVVSSVESDSPLSRVSILFRAGARNESYDILGASHAIRSSAGMSTGHATGFGITRQLQQIGASLDATSDRELISYTVELSREHLDTGLKYLQAAITNQLFKPWELDDNKPRLRADIANVSDQVRAVELLHKAAFRSGLGNSVFIPDYQIAKLNSETLQSYIANNFTTNRAAVVGVGIDHQLLVGFAQNLAIESGAGKDTASSFNGCHDVRLDKSGSFTHVAVATQGAPLKNFKEALAFAVLQAASGIAPATKRGESQGPLAKAINQSSKSAIASSALNVSYSDNGLFGFVVSAKAGSIDKAIKAGVAALKTGSVSDEDIARGKTQVKAAILTSTESGRALNEIIGAQAALIGEVHSVDKLLAEIDALSASDVSNAARKVACGKFSIGAVGNLANVPYADEIN